MEAAGDFADADSAAEAVVGALFPLAAADHREHAGDLAAEVGELLDLLVGLGDLFVALFEPFEAVQGERVGVAEDQVGELPGGDGFALPGVADEQLDVFGVAEQGVDEQLADFAGGSQNALIGILTALVARSRTGRGQHVDTSMTDGVIALSALFVQNYFTSGQPPAPPALNPNPNYTTYETKDGRWVSLGTIEPWFFAAVCRLVGRPDLAEHLHDPAKRQEINDAFQAAFKTRTADEWQRMALEADTAVTKVYDFPEVFEDAQVRHRQMVLELDHPEVGKVRHLGFSPKLSETPGSMRRFPGSRGQHTDEVLAELGYTQSEIGDLHRQGAVS